MKNLDLMYLAMVESLNVADPNAMWDLYTNDDGILVARRLEDELSEEIPADLLYEYIMAVK